MDPRFLEIADGTRLAYRARSGNGPGIVWLGGFNSTMDGNKARAIEAFSARNGRACLVFDYFGHGSSEGAFRDGTVSRWLADTLAVLSRLTEGPQILIGSSMGAWLALLAAINDSARVAAMLLIAPAVDFTETLLWAQLPADAKQTLLERGEWLRPSQYGESYPITRTLIEDGRQHLLLARETLRFGFPIRILQGMRDPDVPWQHAMRVLEMLEADASLTLVKGGDHRLSRPQDLLLLERTLAALVEDLAR
ncbi:MAG: alpha/beta hydrolase [Alphaproteobacteria bacterium]|nr:alpha/beta hydrolase [Alphaproteobacteria bacterium]